MGIRTDLAIDLTEAPDNKIEGVEEQNEQIEDVKITKTKITTKEAEEKLGKPIGDYITVEFPSVEMINDFTNLKKALVDSLKSLAPEKADSVLVVGLGNTDITPDSVGPLTAKGVLATRHITGQFAERIGLKGLRSVAVIAPGVLGQTGVEATELTAATAEKIKPSVVIAVDALASRSVSRLFRTVQLCNTGISPGSGVKNARRELSEKSLNVPVIAVGVPTVVDAYTLAYELTGKEPNEDIKMIVSPKESDILCDRISEIISQALNVFLQPEIDEDIILALV